ncbi:MAG TPA: AMP-binding protein, partial [Elusimicrobiota bacterium]|nr:AMP-binding protein [Elusimicrobiota bacterium]
AANSVVSGHFPSYSLVLGNPARVMGRRGDSAEPATAAPAPRATAAAAPRDVPATAAEIAREIENLLVRLRVLKTPPPPTARLRGEGYVDSLNWALFFEGLTERFGDALTLEEFLSPAMDSVESIAQRLHQRRTTGAPAPRPAPHGLHERLVELARQKPDLEILRLRPEGGGEVRFTYAGLLDAAARWAGAMRAAGFGPGDRVGLLMPLSEDLIVAFVGCLRLGAVPSVFSYPSAKVPLSVYARHHKDMFSRVELKGLITTDDLGKLLRSEVGATLPIAGVPAWRTAAPLAAASPAGLDDTVLIQHSSGTTGIQKGVALTPRAVSVQIDLYARALRLNERDVIVSWLPLYHDMGLVACFLLPLLTGTPLVLLSPFEWVARPGLLFETLAESGGTLVWMPNFAFQLLADRVPPSALHALDLTRVRAWISCSEVVSASTAKDFWETFAESGVDEDKLWSCYAMAENVFAVTQSPRLKILSIDGLLLQKEDRVVPKDGGRPVVSQGVPLPGVDVRVLGRDGAPCPEGRHGEIALRGPCLMSGYYRNPEKTREALRDGWFVTGDLGFLWEGELYVTGRKKDLVIVAGRNFYPQDIEAAAARIPGTKAGRCAAFGCPNPRRGTEDLVIVAERSAPDVDAAAWEAAVKKIVFEELDCPVAEGRL